MKDNAWGTARVVDTKVPKSKRKKRKKMGRGKGQWTISFAFRENQSVLSSILIAERKN